MAIGSELGHFTSALAPPGDTRVRWRSGDEWRMAAGTPVCAGDLETNGGWLNLIVPSALSDSSFWVAHLHSSFLFLWKRPPRVQPLATLHPGQRSV